MFRVSAAHVIPQHASRSGGRRVEAEKGIDERRFTGAVGTQQANRAPPQRASQVLQNVALAKANRKALQFDDGYRRSSSHGLTRALCRSGLDDRAHAWVQGRAYWLGPTGAG